MGTSILLINYKKNLFRSLTNYSISSIKNKQNNFINSYFLYFLRVYFFFTFFFKKLVSNLYNIVLIQIYSFGLNTVVSTFSASDLKKSLKYFPFFTLHGINFFNLFMPQGCPFILIFFIIPIEFVSYVFRLVSLSARLFANMMAGHSLLAVL